jgi:hypothetical protein
MERFETNEPITIALEIGVGDIDIDASDRAETIVDVQPRDPDDRSDVDAARQTVVAFANGTLTVGGNGWRQLNPRRFGSVEIRVEAPTKSAVRADLGVGSIRSSGRLGACRIRSGAGSIALAECAQTEIRSGASDVAVDAIEGRADIKTSGSVRVGRIDGSAALKNPNGDTWIGEITGDGRIVASNGAIVIGRAHGDVVAKTARGDITIAEATRGTVLANSSMGTLEIGVSNGVPAWLDLKTSFGEVRNELDDAERPASDEGSLDIRAHTSMGDVTIKRSSERAAASTS